MSFLLVQYKLSYGSKCARCRRVFTSVLRVGLSFTISEKWIYGWLREVLPFDVPRTSQCVQARLQCHDQQWNRSPWKGVFYPSYRYPPQLSGSHESFRERILSCRHYVPSSHMITFSRWQRVNLDKDLARFRLSTIPIPPSIDRTGQPLWIWLKLRNC